MKTREGMILGVLVALVALVVAGLFLTRVDQGVTVGMKSTPAANAQNTLVDQRPLQTARKLASLASTPEEQNISHEILVNADHEVDLAFADALRDAREHPVKPTPETRELYARLNEDEATVKTDQDRVNSLTKAVAAASADKKDQLEQQQELAQAQLVMDQDELDDAKEDLTRAGGDPEGRIQRLLAEHEASQHDSDSTHNSQTTPADVNYSATNLWAQVLAEYALWEKRSVIDRARQDSLAEVKALSERHEALEKQLRAEQPAKQEISRQTAGLTKQDQSAPAISKADAASTLSSLRRFSEDQKALSDLDKRVQDEQEIADGYGSWIGLVRLRQQTALHGVLRSVLWILATVILFYLINLAIDRYFTELTAEKKHLLTVRIAVRFGVQVLAVLAVLFVLFGVPSQMPTILGLAGAGLTVALKDFIVGFVGWFVLMGPNGIRVGDWVEIDGVGGEVIEIGLLRTVLLETGNWTDSGHPTGRKVAFVNSYAVEGHYFNFSTSGQWLWDELQILIPASQDPYPIVEGIQTLVLAETQKNADLAQEEWQRATSRYRVKSFSAVPAINMRPTPAGVDVIVRYIVQAYERYDVRARLYHEIVDLLQKKQISSAQVSLPVSAPH